MIAALVDSRLTRIAAKRSMPKVGETLATRLIDTPVGTVRVFDSGSTKPCVVTTPDGPDVIEHDDVLIRRASQSLRMACFEMTRFGHSLPKPSYIHSLDQGASAAVGVLDGAGIDKATLCFSHADGIYTLRAARLAPARICSLILSQTPSLSAMHAWTKKIIPRPLRIPVVGRVVTWLFPQKFVASWYPMALPRSTTPLHFQTKALDALSSGACFCLAGVVQGLAQEEIASPSGVKTPCTMVWGGKDHSHQNTDRNSLHDRVPHATTIRFPGSGHFPDTEEPERFAEMILELTQRHA